ncbi:ABC transporter permease [Solihabitans fulvus]|uniref:ABC transporter permease n=1 Tax=Solihabitans fulvus TaxID=1892852 RepID=A0A5B2XNR7_9PSEU|nr:ABC-2 family transporter protein [Solihabitans fulvus]KAA2264604.1 ABC transporter permease [Solihabitans fulvus]
MLIAAKLRAQLSYRVSFALDCLGQALTQAMEMIAILVLFGRVSALGGFAVREVLVMYAFASISFGLSELVIGDLDRLSRYIRSGDFDVLLMRPLGTLPQLMVADVQLRRLGRALTGLAVLGYALSTMDIDWTAPRAFLVVLTPITGTAIFASIWVAACSVTFWLVDSSELPNTLTYGSGMFTSYPITVFGGWLRKLLAFVVPGAFVSYYPTLAVLGRPDPLGAPGWVSWLSPVVALVAMTAAGWLWRFAVRHYRGTGS